MQRLSRFGAEHERAFLDAFARAVLTWQDVEEGLYLVFAVLIQGRNHEVVSAAFHSVQGASSKLSVVDSACRIVVKDTDLEPIWKSLHKKILKRITDRNALAHLSVAGEIGNQPQLGRSFFDYRQQKPTYKEYTIADLNECTRKFNSLAEEIETFFQSVDEVLRPAGVG